MLRYRRLRPDRAVGASASARRDDCVTIAASGAQKGGIEHTRERMVARGVLLGIPRLLGVEPLPDGFAITTDDEATQPWHWIAIPIMGITAGEIFYLAELAQDCAADQRYEFMFVAPALPITGAVGSPTHPLAIK